MNSNFLNFDESLEIWRDIKGYEGLYQVSNFGRVKSLPRNGTKGCILKQHFHHYWLVDLCKDGKSKHKLVHRLVAEAFLENPNDLPQVNHKDENTKNNNVNNLEWCTSSYNMNYGTLRERMSLIKKKTNPKEGVES